MINRPLLSQASTARLSRTKRIDYIDLVKGIAIIGVVWSHTVHPQWYNVSYINALFFFLSGFFFKEEPFPVFFKKKIKTLIIPFTFFYLISYPFRIVLNLLDHHTLSNFDWACILDVFDITNRNNYLFVNVPLWFIFCLFIMQLIYWCMNKVVPTKYRTWIYIIVIAITIIWNDNIQETPSIFMINKAIEWLPYFIAGNLFGLKLSHLIFHYKYPYILVIATLIAFLGLQAIPCDVPAYFFLKAILFFLCILSFFTYFDENKGKICRIIRTLGVSTLFILCAHTLIQVPIQLILMKIFGQREVFTGYIDTTLTLLIIYLFIPIVNRYLPWAVGKKR
ncbi:MAG TPA: acyltransferase [Candidatus Barnesiella excrementavium]|nr:acyltransferase [Candidatus Barnesiella excrementavium]